VFEGAALAADALLDFRYALLDRLATAERTTRPTPVTAPDWPAGTLRVRVPDRGEPRAEPYALGGRVIEDAWPDAKQELIRPADLDDRPRIFVLGGSAALGFPYRHDDSLAVRLGALLPDHQVVNAGQVGWTSGQVAGVAGVVAERFEPDLLVVYTGNNEWIHWPAGDVSSAPDLQRSLATSRALAAALYLGHRLSEGRPASDDPPPLVGHAHALRHPDRTLDIASWERQREEHLRVLRRNLVAMTDLGVPVLFLTVPFSYRLAPSFHRPQPDAFRLDTADEVRALLRDAAGAVDGDRCDRALPLLGRALDLDPGPPVLHYLEAVCLERAGDDAGAEAAYARSRDRTVGNLGARLAVNDVIRDVARRRGAMLVDAAALFDEHQHARGRFFNEELIHDDCHPTPLGHRLLAEAVARTVRERR
jgi:hypothetical protein